MAAPTLTFNFRAADLHFHRPERILEARRVEDVPPLLAAGEAAAAAGLYAAGWLAYEAAPAFDPAMDVHPPGRLPLAWFGLFDEPISGAHTEVEDRFRISPWRASVSRAEYDEAIRRILEAIAGGETYQVNYTLRLRAAFSGSETGLYMRLRRAQGAAYHARMDLGRFRIISASPELFFHWKDGCLIARPMKGTMRRGLSTPEDQRLREALCHSGKDRAENVMVVDMMRSDMGRIGVPGSVRVESLFDAETYPTVHQMTSTITARTRVGTRLADVFRALFPSASITGAPKVNTMRWIKALEPGPRGVYCGAIGYVRPGGEAIFSVPIRTLTLDTETGMAEYGVGGGVTWDSTREGEYAEAWLKADILTRETPAFDLLETLRLEHGEYRLLARHLDRLSSSARYFGFPPVRAAARTALRGFAEAHPVGAWRVRLLVPEDGVPRVEGAPLAEDSRPRVFTPAKSPVDSQDRFLYHKTTRRDVYERHRAGHGSIYDVLLWNERGELTEFTTGNLALRVGGRCYTPPVESGLLAGTFRDYLLRAGEITERALTREDLRAASRVWLLNSVRGWVELRDRDSAPG